VKLVLHTVCQKDKRKRPLHFTISGTEFTTTTEVALAADG